MTLQNELQEAECWFKEHPLSVQEGFSKLVLLVVSSLYGENEEAFLTPLFSTFRAKFKMWAHFILSDRELIQKSIFQNLLLIFYRLCKKRPHEELLEESLSFLEKFFFHFRAFLEEALSKTERQKDLSSLDAQNASLFITEQLFSLLFPKGSESILLPKLPLLFQQVASSFLEEIYKKALESSAAFVTSFLVDQKRKEQCLINMVLVLHSFLLSIEKKTILHTSQQENVQAFHKRAEALVEQIYFCLAHDQERAVRFCPKYKGSDILLTILPMAFCIVERKGMVLMIRFLLHLMDAKRADRPSVSWVEMEEQITDRKIYEALVTRLAEKKMDWFQASPIQLLVHGVISYAVQSSLDDFPWDERFDDLLFGLRRIRSFIVSRHFLLFASGK